MSELIAIAYPTEERARAALETIRQLQAAHLVDLDDACYVTRDPRGRVELHQTINVTARGALGGAFWGSLVGLLLLNPLLGLVTGAATGAVAGRLTDVGISDAFMRQLATEVEPGRAVLFVLLRRVTLDKVLPELGRQGGTVLHTSLPHDVDARLRAALDAPSPLPPAQRLITPGVPIEPSPTPSARDAA